MAEAVGSVFRGARPFVQINTPFFRVQTYT
jgi:hypothetical protein